MAHWPTPKFPPGVHYYEAYLLCKDAASKNMAGKLYVKPETPLVHPASGWFMDDEEIEISAWGGEVLTYLPYSNQGGFTDGLSDNPISGFAFNFRFQPVRAAAAATTRLTPVNMPTSGTVDGARVLIANLMDLAVWPHAPTGGDPVVVSSIQFVADTDSGDQGLYRVMGPAS